MFEGSKTERSGNVITATELFSYGKEDYKPLNLPELGGKVYLRQLSAREVLSLGDMTGDDVTGTERTAANNQMLAAALVNQNGTRIIPPGDEDKLSDIPAKLYSKLVNAVMEGISDVSSASAAVNAVATGEPAGNAES